VRRFLTRLLDWICGVPNRPTIHPVNKLLRHPENGHRVLMAIIHSSPGETFEVPVDTDNGPRVLKVTHLHRAGSWLVKRL